ncbi:putative TAR RNA loop binding protein [Paratrimastix pyriformis]|uniref:TAR RNA loop binding protein n=1 Tax=Paratrimastix pyriformis TaxID=342808 RepID=A0ABQ8UJA2_9EUKA|nr:putative TAR RNA loop binding protein [Paratrimastix pyriformis]
MSVGAGVGWSRQDGTVVAINRSTVRARNSLAQWRADTSAFLAAVRTLLSTFSVATLIPTLKPRYMLALLGAVRKHVPCPAHLLPAPGTACDPAEWMPPFDEVALTMATVPRRMVVGPKGWGPLWREMSALWTVDLAAQFVTSVRAVLSRRHAVHHHVSPMAVTGSTAAWADWLQSQCARFVRAELNPPVASGPAPRQPTAAAAPAAGAPRANSAAQPPLDTTAPLRRTGHLVTVLVPLVGMSAQWLFGEGTQAMTRRSRYHAVLGELFGTLAGMHRRAAIDPTTADLCVAALRSLLELTGAPAPDMRDRASPLRPAATGACPRPLDTQQPALASAARLAAIEPSRVQTKLVESAHAPDSAQQGTVPAEADPLAAAYGARLGAALEGLRDYVAEQLAAGGLEGLLGYLDHDHTQCVSFSRLGLHGKALLSLSRWVERLAGSTKAIPAALTHLIPSRLHPVPTPSPFPTSPRTPSRPHPVPTYLTPSRPTSPRPDLTPSRPRHHTFFCALLPVGMAQVLRMEGVLQAWQLRRLAGEEYRQLVGLGRLFMGPGKVLPSSQPHSLLVGSLRALRLLPGVASGLGARLPAALAAMLDTQGTQLKQEGGLQAAVPLVLRSLMQFVASLLRDRQTNITGLDEGGERSAPPGVGSAWGWVRLGLGPPGVGYAPGVESARIESAGVGSGVGSAWVWRSLLGVSMTSSFQMEYMLWEALETITRELAAAKFATAELFNIIQTAAADAFDHASLHLAQRLAASLANVAHCLALVPDPATRREWVGSAVRGAYSAIEQARPNDLVATAAILIGLAFDDSLLVGCPELSLSVAAAERLRSGLEPLSQQASEEDQEPVLVEVFGRLALLGAKTHQVIPLLLERVLPKLLAHPALLPPYVPALRFLASWGPDPLPQHLAPEAVPAPQVPNEAANASTRRAERTPGIYAHGTLASEQPGRFSGAQAGKKQGRPGHPASLLVRPGQARPTGEDEDGEVPDADEATPAPGAAAEGDEGEGEGEGEEIEAEDEPDPSAGPSPAPRAGGMEAGEDAPDKAPTPTSLEARAEALFAGTDALGSKPHPDASYRLLWNTEYLVAAMDDPRLYEDYVARHRLLLFLTRLSPAVPAAHHAAGVLLTALLEQATSAEQTDLVFYVPNSDIHRGKTLLMQAICCLAPHLRDPATAALVRPHAHKLLFQSNLVTVRQYVELIIACYLLALPHEAASLLLPILSDYATRAQAVSSVMHLGTVLLHHMPLVGALPGPAPHPGDPATYEELRLALVKGVLPWICSQVNPIRTYALVLLSTFDMFHDRARSLGLLRGRMDERVPTPAGPTPPAPMPEVPTVAPENMTLGMQCRQIQGILAPFLSFLRTNTECLRAQVKYECRVPPDPFLTCASVDVLAAALDENVMGRIKHGCRDSKTFLWLPELADGAPCPPPHPLAVAAAAREAEERQQQQQQQEQEEKEKEQAEEAAAAGQPPVADQEGTMTSADTARAAAMCFQRKPTPAAHAMTNETTGLKSLEKKGRQSMIVVATFVEKLPNLGGLARTCEVFGAEALVVADKSVASNPIFKTISVTADKWVPMVESQRARARRPQPEIHLLVLYPGRTKNFSAFPHTDSGGVRVTAATHFDLRAAHPQVPESGLVKYLRERKQEGYTILGLEQTASSTHLHHYDFPEKVVFLLGKEREGIPVEYLQIVDRCIEIPQFGLIRSLNVHVSCSILIWEYTRQQLNRQPAAIADS